jgi:hypothetical protein
MAAKKVWKWLKNLNRTVFFALSKMTPFCLDLNGVIFQNCDILGYYNLKIEMAIILNMTAIKFKKRLKI